MLTVSHLSLAYGKKILFDDISANFTKGNCYGIIGANGAGKSTFLKILSGEIEPNKGNVDIMRGNRIAVLKQNHAEFNDCIALNTVLMGHKKLWELFQKREELYSKAELSEEDGLQAGTIETEFGEIGGYTAESDAAMLLSDLGVDESLHGQLMKDIDGSLKVRILLAQALFGNPDILLLDEPTNDLEIETVNWLENFLASYQNIVLVVSHDRHFLDAVCTHIVDIDRQKVKIYPGNYSFWYESSQLASKQLADKNKKNEEKRKDLLEFIARFSANASKSKQATSRKKALEKIVIEEITPSNRKRPGIFFTPERELGNNVLEVRKLAKKLGDKTLFSNVSFSVSKTDKIGLVSKNQLAVSHFYDIIGEQAPADEGDFEWGSTTIRAFLPLENEAFFKENMPLIEWLRQYAPKNKKDVDEPFLRGFLGRMLFSGEDAQKSTRVLSGGEKMRCMISKMMIQNPNVICLNQPTNHLDLESITAFNEGTIEMKGVVFLSSHDHQFMQSSVNRIIEITPKGVIDKSMTYDEYIADEKIKELQAELYGV